MRYNIERTFKADINGYPFHSERDYYMVYEIVRTLEEKYDIEINDKELVKQLDDIVYLYRIDNIKNDKFKVTMDNVKYNLQVKNKSFREIFNNKNVSRFIAYMKEEYDLEV